MKGDALLIALDLPASSRVDRRVPKKLLLENGAPTAADKRRINEGIGELFWLAALKPTTIGVPEYRDEAHEYLEIAVLYVALRPGTKMTRLVELVHRAIPYPVLLLTDDGAQSTVSAAHKRWSQGEAGKIVLEDDVISTDWDAARDAERWPAFRDALAMGNQPRGTLYSLYQGWIDTLLALQSARLTGDFAVAVDAQQAAVRREALRDYARLTAEIASLRAAAAKEKQITRRVEMNLQLKQVETRFATIKGRL